MIVLQENVIKGKANLLSFIIETVNLNLLYKAGEEKQ